LTQLVDSGTLAPDAASELAAILDRDLPPVGTWGLTHGDFSAENIVVRPDGALVSVDNELVSRGFIEWDVARRWYRWPMPAWAEERFATAYVDAGGPAVQSQRSERAWRIAAAVKGVHLRTRLGGSLERGLDTLQLLLAVPTPT
jgi:aminoglycoside phosphotransferase (APT) family kinase protein